MTIDRYKAEWVRWLGQKKWDDYLTVNFNCHSNQRAARTQLGKLIQRLDSHLLGARYRYKQEQRTFLVAFPEHVYSNYHFHCLVRYQCARRPTRSTLGSVLELYWRQLVPSGTVHLQSVYDPEGAVLYSMKEFRSFEAFDQILFSDSFWPSSILDREQEHCGDSRQRNALMERAQYAKLKRRRLAS